MEPLHVWFCYTCVLMSQYFNCTFYVRFQQGHFFTQYVAKCSIVWHLWALSCYVLSCNMWCTELYFVCQFEFMTWKKMYVVVFIINFRARSHHWNIMMAHPLSILGTAYIKTVICAVLYQLCIHNPETYHHSFNYVIDISVQNPDCTWKTVPWACPNPFLSPKRLWI